MASKDVEAGRAHVLIAIRDMVSGGLKKIERNLAGFGRSFATLGATMTATSIGPIASVMRAFAPFDAQMARVGAITGATANDLANLRNEAKRLGSTTQFTASQAAEGMVYLGMAGYNTSQILNAIGPVLSLAAAGMLDLGRASDIVSDAQTAFGLSAADAARVADVLAKTATSSNTSVEQMGEAFTYAAAQGKSAGQSIEMIAAALGVLGNSGLKASIAGTGVQGIFKRLVEQDALEQLGRLGVAFADVNGNVRPLVDLMSDLQAATSSMTQLKKLQTFESLFGLHAKSALILADNSAALSDLTNSLYGASGAAEEMAKQVQNSTMGSWLGLLSALESVQIALGESIAEPARKLIDVFAFASRSMSAFISANKPLFRIVGIGAFAIGLLGAALTAIGGSALLASFVVGGLATAFSTVLSLLAGLFTPLGLLVVSIIAAGVAAWTFRDRIASAFAAVAEYTRPFTDAIGRVWSVFSEAFGGIVSALMSGNLQTAAGIAWLGFVAAAWQGVAELGGAITTALDFLQAWIPGVAGIRDYVAGAFASIGQSILAGRWDLAGAIAMTKLKIVWVTGLNFVKDAFALITTGLKNTWLGLADFIADVWHGAINAVAQGIVWVMEQLGIASEGTMAQLQRMQAAEAAARQKRRDSRADPNEAMYARMMERQKQLASLQQHLSELEGESATAYAAAGAPTIADAAAAAREELATAIEQAQEQARSAQDNPETRGLQAQARLGSSQLSKLSSMGTFGATAAALSLGFNAKPQEETAANTRKMLRHMERQQPGVARFAN